MNYSENPRSCRVDFFTESGKWKYTNAVVFTDEEYRHPIIHEAFARALHRALYDTKHQRMTYGGLRAVCLTPYHVHEHPISLLVDDVLGMI
jgi:hypothetical protein